MSKTFSGLEMLKIAIFMEEEGADFYQNGAENTSGEVREFLLNAAVQELSHKEMFEKLYDDMSSGKEEETEYLFDEEVSKYLASITEGQVFNKNENLDAFKNLNEAVINSLNKEKVTVEIYTELYKGVKDEDAKLVMNKIIDEEKKHVEYFEELLNTL